MHNASFAIAFILDWAEQAIGPSVKKSFTFVLFGVLRHINGIWVVYAISMVFELHVFTPCQWYLIYLTVTVHKSMFPGLFLTST